MYGPKYVRQQALREGAAARQRAMAEAMQRKEEYLGARVPKELKERVIVQANKLGIPVSILIRNVLEEAFGDRVPEAAVSPLRRTDVEREASKQQATQYPSVLGWKEINLNKELACSGCGRRMESGDQVMLGIALSGESHVILCDLCKESL